MRVALLRKRRHLLLVLILLWHLIPRLRTRACRHDEQRRHRQRKPQLEPHGSVSLWLLWLLWLRHTRERRKAGLSQAGGIVVPLSDRQIERVAVPQTTNLTERLTDGAA